MTNATATKFDYAIWVRDADSPALERERDKLLAEFYALAADEADCLRQVISELDRRAVAAREGGGLCKAA